MSEEKNMQKLIKEFTKKVKEKLPEWLKEKKEHKEILIELEEHIWDRAAELSDTGKPTERTVRLAIAYMGTPQTIAKEYKRRGTPKYYITEELWPLYKKWLIGVIMIIIILHIISFIIKVIFGNGDWGTDFNIFSNILVAFAIITIIFVALSMEGYLPEDFKSKKQLEKEKLKIEKAKAEGLPLHPRTGKPLKPIVKPNEKIAGGIISIIFATILLVQPFPSIEDLIHIEFLAIIRIAGIFMLADGGITLTRGLLGNEEVTGQQILLVITAVLKFGSIWLFILFMGRPDICPIIYMKNPEETLIATTIPEKFHQTYQNIWIVIIVIQIISACYDIYKAGSLEKYKNLI